MLRSTPIAAINTTIAVLPELINGSGTPVGGMLPVTTAMLISTCVAIIATMPVAK